MDVVIIVVMLVFSGFFSASEIAFVAANRLKAEARARQGGRVGRIVQGFIADPASVLTTTLVGNNLALVLYSTLMAVYLEGPVEVFCRETLGLETGAELAALTLVTLIASTVVLIFGEILPKSIAQQLAGRAIFVLAPPLKVFHRSLGYVVRFCEWIANVLIRMTGQHKKPAEAFLRRDFEVMIRDSKERGTLELDEDESTLLTNVLELDTVRVKESMVPRTDIEAVENTATIAEVRAEFQATGYSKLPVYEDNIDRITGVIFASDLFYDPQSIADMIRPVRYVPDTKRSKDLMREFLAERTSIAIVIDEYGGTAGLVTIEDLIEELTGDIHDEHDQEEFVVRQLDENTYVVSGRAEIDELKEKWGMELPEGDYETVAGFLLEYLGVIPEPKDEHLIEGYRFQILQATSNRIDLIKIFRIPEL